MRGNFSDAKGPEKTMCIKGTSGEPADPVHRSRSSSGCFTTGDDARDDRRSFFGGTDSAWGPRGAQRRAGCFATPSSAQDARGFPRPATCGVADAVAVLANGHYSFIIPAQPETPTAPLSLKRVLLEPRRHYADDYKGVEEENVFGRQWAAWTDAVLTRAHAKGHEGERLTPTVGARTPYSTRRAPHTDCHH